MSPDNDGAQNILFQNMASWHIKYPKLKGLKWQKQEGSLRPFLKQVIKLPCQRYPHCSRRREDILIIRDGVFGVKTSVKTNLAKLILIFILTFSSFVTPSSNPIVLLIFY